MTNEFQAKLIEEFAHEMARRIGEAAVLAQVAEDYGKKGLTERALKSFLQIEPLLFEASRIMSAGLIVHRRDCDRAEYV